MMWRSVITFVALIIQAGCSVGPSPDQFLSPSELSNLVTDRTVYIPSWYIPACCNTSEGTLLYLAKDGTGWLDGQVLPGYPPRPSGMSMVFNWRVEDGSQLCLWASPRIGEMSSFAPPFQQCLQVLRSRESPEAFRATALLHGQLRTGWIELHALNGFPQPVIDQYLTQVRVLYGGHIPAWGLP